MGPCSTAVLPLAMPSGAARQAQRFSTGLGHAPPPTEAQVRGLDKPESGLEPQTAALPLQIAMSTWRCARRAWGRRARCASYRAGFVTTQVRIASYESVVA